MSNLKVPWEQFSAVSQKCFKDSLTYSVTHTGFLVKRGKVRKSWKKRWCVVTANLFIYYSDEKDASGALGLVLLEHAKILPVAEPVVEGNQFVFSIQTIDDRLYYMSAFSEEDRSQWLAVLERAKLSTTRLRLRKESEARQLLKQQFETDRVSLEKAKDLYRRVEAEKKHIQAELQRKAGKYAESVAQRERTYNNEKKWWAEKHALLAQTNEALRKAMDASAGQATAQTALVASLCERNAMLEKRLQELVGTVDAYVSSQQTNHKSDPKLGNIDKNDPKLGNENNSDPESGNVDSNDDKSEAASDPETNPATDDGDDTSEPADEAAVTTTATELAAEAAVTTTATEPSLLPLQHASELAKTAITRNKDYGVRINSLAMAPPPLPPPLSPLTLAPGVPPVSPPKPKPVSQPPSPNTVASGNPLRVWVGSWNMGAADPFSEMGDAVSVSQALETFVPMNCDVYVLGVQEGCNEEVFKALEVRLASRYVQHVTLPKTKGMCCKVSGRGDGSLLKPKFTGIACYVSQRLLQSGECSVVAAAAVGDGSLGSKGVTACLMQLRGATVCFVNSHLAAFKPQQRRKQLGKFMKSLGHELGDPDLGLRDQFHHVVFFGDLNYRIQGLTPDQVLKALSDATTNASKGNPLHTLHDKYDGLRLDQAMADSVFFDYTEAIKAKDFFPTYKKFENRQDTDYSDPTWPQNVYRVRYKEPFYKGAQVKNRVPGWCDRIIWRSSDSPSYSKLTIAREGSGPEFCYKSVNDGPGMSVSDHSPVYGIFNLVSNRFAPMATPGVGSSSLATPGVGSASPTLGGASNAPVRSFFIRLSVGQLEVECTTSGRRIPITYAKGVFPAPFEDASTTASDKNATDSDDDGQSQSVSHVLRRKDLFGAGADSNPHGASTRGHLSLMWRGRRSYKQLHLLVKIQFEHDGRASGGAASAEASALNKTQTHDGQCSVSLETAQNHKAARFRVPLCSEGGFLLRSGNGPAPKPAEGDDGGLGLASYMLHVTVTVAAVSVKN